MLIRITYILACLIIGCGTEGGRGGGDRNLPNAGFGPYAWHEEDDSPRNLFPNDDTLEAPFAFPSNSTLALFLSSCPVDEPCRIVKATSEDGFRFTDPDVVATHSDGLRDPYVIRQGTEVYLWALSADRSKVFVFQWTNSKFEFQNTILSAAPGTSFSGLSVLDSPVGTRVYLRHHVEDPVWILVQLDASQNRTEVDLCGTECWSIPPPHDYELKTIQTAIGNRHLRGLGTATNRSGESILGFIGSLDGTNWTPYQFNPVLMTERRLGSASFTQFAGRYFIYAKTGQRMPRIIMASSDRGQPSTAPAP